MLSKVGSAHHTGGHMEIMITNRGHDVKAIPPVEAGHSAAQALAAPTEKAELR